MSASNYDSFIETEIAMRLLYLQEIAQSSLANDVNCQLGSSVIELINSSYLTKSMDRDPNYFCTYRFCLNFKIINQGYRFSRNARNSFRYECSKLCHTIVNIDYNEDNIDIEFLLNIDLPYSNITRLDTPKYEDLNKLYSSIMLSVLDGLKEVEKYIRW